MPRSAARLPRAFISVCLALALAATAAPAGAQWSQDFWIATWATAVVGRPQSPQPPSAPSWLHLTNQTIRQIVHTSMGGSSARVVFSNAFGTAPVTIGAAAIAERDGSGRTETAVRPGTVRPLRFGGRPSATIAPGAVLVSDVVDFIVPSLGDVAIDLYLPGTTDTPSPLAMHHGALQTSYVSSPGNVTGSATFEPAATTRSWFLLSRLEVTGTPGSATVATLGDSITDGTASTPDTNRRWPDRLAERLTTWNSRLGVANLGIAGNRVLADGGYAFGVNMQARLDRDVLALPNIQHLIVLGGINDIGMGRGAAAPSADAIVGGHQQVVARARSRGIRVYGGTLTPFEGAGYYTAEGEATRQAVNAWIRTSGVYDGVIDFDAVTRDPAHPSRLLPAYDSGDHLHPSDAGYTAMGDAIPRELFGPPSNRR
ncbi:MAG: SGNH/GDSL hydrolase family protein [Vicinamibacterales bacterium]